MNAAACKNLMILEMVLVSCVPLSVGVRGYLHCHSIGGRG